MILGLNNEYLFKWFGWCKQIFLLECNHWFVIPSIDIACYKLVSHTVWWVFAFLSVIASLLRLRRGYLTFGIILHVPYNRRLSKTRGSAFCGEGEFVWQKSRFNSLSRASTWPVSVIPNYFQMLVYIWYTIAYIN